jgi:hypothetical protein
MYYKRKTSSQRKYKVSQDQVAWLMMELQTMREYNETLQNNNGSQTKSATNTGQNK